MSNPRKPKTTGAQPVFPNSPYIQPIRNTKGLIVGYRAFTNEGAFHVRYDLSAPKSYTPPQMLAHVPQLRLPRRGVDAPRRQALLRPSASAALTTRTPSCKAQQRHWAQNKYQ